MKYFLLFTSIFFSQLAISETTVYETEVYSKKDECLLRAPYSFNRERIARFTVQQARKARRSTVSRGRL